ncbi:MAG: heavy-metal-associated domain-containing protein [Anaerolineales bacterium]
MPDYQKIKLRVVGENTIHCAGCERTVEFTLSRMPGLEKVKADRETQDIAFELKPSETDLEQIKDGLEWLGYQVEVT